VRQAAFHAQGQRGNPRRCRTWTARFPAPASQALGAGRADWGRQSLLLQQNVLDRDNDEVIEPAPGIACQPTDGAMDVLGNGQRRAAAPVGIPGRLPPGGASRRAFRRLCGRKSRRRVGALVHEANSSFLRIQSVAARTSCAAGPSGSYSTTPSPAQPGAALRGRAGALQPQKKARPSCSTGN
jgi:hypothetical protein